MNEEALVWLHSCCLSMSSFTSSVVEFSMSRKSSLVFADIARVVELMHVKLD